ncbi:MAG: hypothetical protein FJW66_00600 [Actinobacteria bacterium]|nr:hypothetical protein [Actinomycetota bacterium]
MLKKADLAAEGKAPSFHLNFRNNDEIMMKYKIYTSVFSVAKMKYWISMKKVKFLWRIRKTFVFFLFFILISLLVTASGCNNPSSTQKKNVNGSAESHEETEQTTADISDRNNYAGSEDSVSTNTEGSIIIGVEYVFPGLADDFAETGIRAVKPFPEAIMWEKMQKSADSPVDYSVLDRFVKEYQEAGFENVFITLRSRNNWASKDYITNHSPKEQYMDLYKAWVSGIAERYDMDGIDDMPGLLRPAIYFEIGSEFSTYEPEPVDDYIEMLKVAYEAIHEAAANAIVLHVPFLTTTAFKDHPEPQDYEKTFAEVDKRIMYHSLEEIRELLDSYDFFDAVNIHLLGHPYEIEANIEWLNYEMNLRGYKKPIIISDTSVSPFVAWGPANDCEIKIPKPGIIIPPATEKDRCRLAEYFKKLIEGDEGYLNWVRAFCAADIAKMVTVAAEQKVALINTAFTEDFELAQTEIFGAAAGNASWSGMTKVKMNYKKNEHEVVQKYPSFYALKQIAGYLKEYESVERVSFEDDSIRVYEIESGKDIFYIAWYEPGYLVLPEDPVPEKLLELDVIFGKVTLEKLIAEVGRQEPEKETVSTQDGILKTVLTNVPVFIFPE